MRLEIRSPIAGSVWSHVTSVGQRVEVGSVLLIVECMKCEIPVESTVSGTVTWLRPCAETVEAEDVVAALEVA